MILEVIIGTIATVVVLATAIYYSQKKRTDLIVSRINSLPGFSLSHILVSTHKGVALDQSNKQIAIAVSVQDKVETFIFPFTSITGIDIQLIEGNAVTKKTGFVSFTTQNSLQEITISITLSSAEIPLFRIPLYIAIGKPDALSATLQQQAMDQANLWEGLISSIVRANHTEFDTQQPQKSLPGTLATEIQALHRLQIEGILTLEEFNTAKSRLINAQGKSASKLES
jgi:hypothetical protein